MEEKRKLKGKGKQKQEKCEKLRKVIVKTVEKLKTNKREKTRARYSVGLA